MQNFESSASILVIYTGGTIGMIMDPKDEQLKPFAMDSLIEALPELAKFNFRIYSKSFSDPIDSSDMNPNNWIELANIIHENIDKYDGFVILHGTDTMAYTASALSFMLSGLTKPVILTGSQLPIGMIRTDGKENLITALEIATMNKTSSTEIKEVAIFFDNILFRGNRTTKISTRHFDAFSSPNYPKLAEAGVDISIDEELLLKNNTTFKLLNNIDRNVAILPLFPGIKAEVIEAVCGIPNLKALVLRTYGSGNAQREKALLEALSKFIENDGIVLNISQCPEGKVRQRKYQTGAALADLGVIPGGDMTLESAITKLMVCLGNMSVEQTKQALTKSICGEVSL